MATREEYGQYLMDSAIKCGIPRYMVPSIALYVTDGVEPGGFLLGVLWNNFKYALEMADDENIKALKGYAQFLRWHLPASCHGSPAKVQAWIDRGGIFDDEPYEMFMY